MRKIAIASALILTLSACASAPTQGGRGNRNFITLDEIQKARAPGWYAWDLISALRPHFLKSQSAVTLTDRDPVFPDVYVDDLYHGEIESLKSLRLDTVKGVQLLSPFDAKTRFAKDMLGGAILIYTL